MGHAKLASAVQTTAPSFRVTLHADLRDPEIRHHWIQFENAAPITAFQRLDFVEGLLTHLGSSERKPVIVAVREGDRIVMLTTLVRRERFGLTIIENLDYDLCDYTVPLAAPDRIFSADEMTEIGEEIFQALKPADAIILKKIRPAVYGHENPFALLPDIRPMNASFTTLRLPPKKPGRNSQQSRQPVAFRDAGKKLRRLAQIAPVSFTAAQTPAELSEALDVMVAQRLERFAEMHRPDVLANPEVAGFYRQLALQGLEDGKVRVLSLKVGDQTIAVVYALEHRHTLTVLIPSMSTNERWKIYSPGLLALVKSVQWAHANGLRHCDLGVGGLGYKSRFGAKEQQLYEVSRALTLRGLLAVGEAGLRRNYRSLGLRFPGLDARVRRTLRK
jgi:CelD/BcsL family acetyltransferase involved in cellulose biosynthesis